MSVKIFAAVVAVALMIAYLTPVVLKLKDLALGCIILIGLAMMLTDLWQSLRTKDD